LLLPRPVPRYKFSREGPPFLTHVGYIYDGRAEVIPFNRGIKEKRQKEREERNNDEMLKKILFDLLLHNACWRGIIFIMGLSKTKYCKGVQCPKILWMDTNMPEQFDRLVMNEKTLQTGAEVGDLAMSYFGEFSEVPYSEDFNAMLTETQRLLETGATVITEAAFSYEDDFCLADILRRVQNGFELVEVKSSTGSAFEKPEKVKSIYIHDMAYQAYVLRKCGINLTKISVMLLNRDYVRRGELNLQELFALVDCTKIVNGLEVENRIAEIKSTASQLTEPSAVIGSRCSTPYECGYKNWCYRNLPVNNVFHIGWSMWGSKKDDAYRSGFVSFDEVLTGGVKLTEKQRRQIMSETDNLPPFIDCDAIRSFLSKIRYPLYFLDMETYMQAVPQWDSLSPYSQILFQYSIHIQENPHEETRHLECLCKEGIDPRREIAERLCADIPTDVCIMAYNTSFEKARIKELSLLFHDLEKHLMNLHDNMIDLAEPFRTGAYYCREMGGSYSIKSVLPALCPNDPELDYNALNLVHNGIEAMNAFCDLHTKTLEQIAETRKALLAYCKLDTLAMVKILGKLYTVTWAV